MSTLPVRALPSTTPRQSSGFCSCFPHAALLHRGYQIEHVAASLARETVKTIFGRTNVERIEPLALMNGTPPAQLTAAALEGGQHIVMCQHLLDAHRLFDRSKIYPHLLLHKLP